jgi:hypothetical protein
MKIGFLIIGIYAVAAGVLLFVYERPRKSRRKLTGRGGDFES